MVNAVNPDVYNPYIGYKLDPGEPGLSNSVPASLSILRVAAHEAGNINQFKSQAIKNGGVVIYTDIDLHFQKRGGFLAAVAGKSKAVILYKKENVISKPQENDSVSHSNEQEIENKIQQNVEKEIEKIKMQIMQETDPEKITKLLQKLQTLELLRNNASSLNAEFFLGLELDLSA